MNNNQSRNKSLIQGTLLYGIGSFGTKILSIIIVPLYTYYISTSEMGVYDLLQTTIRLLTPLVTFQISDAAYRWMVRNERVEDSIKATYRLLFINSIIYILAINLMSLIVPIPYAWYFSIALVSSRALETTQKLLRGLKNQKLFAGSSIVYSITFLFLNVFLIVGLKRGVESLFLSQIISDIITIIVIFLFEKRIRFNPIYKTDFPFTKELLAFSIPLVPNILNWWVMNASDRYVIRFFLGASFNGIYAISYKFPNLLQHVLALFNNSWQDLAISETDNNQEYYSKVFKEFYFFSLTIVPLAITVSQLYILLTMNQTYHEAAMYVGYLILGTVFQSFSSFLGVGYMKDKNTIQASLTSIYGAIINLIVNIVLIQAIGLTAASLSTFCGFFVMFIIRYIQTRSSLKIKIEWSKFIPLVLIALSVAITSQFYNLYICFVITIISLLYSIFMNRKLIPKIISSLTKKQTGK